MRRNVTTRYERLLEPPEGSFFLFGPRGSGKTTWLAQRLPEAARIDLLDVASLARDAGVARTTVNEYLGILEDTLLAVRLPAYEAKLRVRERAHPKLYWIDPGIVRAVRGSSGAPVGDERGALLEGLVLMLLRLYRDTRRLCDDISFWSPGESRFTEVDFLGHRGDEAVAVEVKSAERVREDHLKGLRAIAALPGLRRRVLVHLGSELGRSAHGIDTLPFERFSEQLAAGRLFEG